MAIMCFSFLIALIGLALGFIGDVTKSETTTVIGALIVIASIFCFAAAFVYRIYWTVRQLFKRIGLKMRGRN